MAPAVPAISSAVGSKHSARRLWLWVAALLGVALGSSGASLGQPSGGPLLATLWGLLTIVACVLVGMTVFRAAVASTPSRGLGALEMLPQALGLGTLVMGLAACALAAAGLFRAPALVALVLSAVVAGAVGLRKQGWPASARVHPLLTGTAGGVWLIPGGALLLSVGCAVLVPSFYYDALVYHFAIPTQMLAHGGFVHLPGLVYANFPLLVDVLNGCGLAVDSTGVATAVFNFAFAPFTVLALWDAARLAVGARGAAFAVILWTCAMLPAEMAAVASNDTPLTFFTAVCAAAALRYRRTGQLRWLWQAALMAGAAFFTKNVGALTTVLVLGAVLAWWKMRRRIAASWVHLAAAGALSVCVNAPTFVRNMVFSGNPVMPALYGVLGGQDWSPLEADNFRAEMRSVPLTPAGLVRIPQAVVRTLVERPQQLGRDAMGVLTSLGMIPALWMLFSRRRRRALGLWGLWAFQMFTWAISFQTERFLTASLLTLCAIQGLALAAVWRHTRPGVRLAATAVWLMGTAVNAAAVHQAVALWQPGWWQVLAGAVDRTAYIRTQADYTQAQEHAARLLLPDQKVLMLGEGRTFYLSVPVWPTSAMNVSPLVSLMRDGASAEEMVHALRNMHVGAVLLRPNEMARLASSYATWQLTQPERDGLVAFLRSQLRMAYASENGRTLLFVLPRPAAGPDP